MDKLVKGVLDIPRFGSFPQNLNKAREFIKLKGLNSELIDDETLAAIVDKVNKKQSLTSEEIRIMHDVVDLGDTCGCDSDHRIRGEVGDGKSIGYSVT